MKKTLLVLLPCIMCLMLPLSASAQFSKTKKSQQGEPDATSQPTTEVRNMQTIIADIDASMTNISHLVQECKDSIREYQRIIDRKDGELATTADNLERANEQSQEYMRQRDLIANPMLNYITQQVVNRSFGSTEQSEINDLFTWLRTIEGYGITVDDARIALQALQNFQNEQNLYLRANQALNQPYDRNTVPTLQRDVNNYISRHLNDNTVQKQQMEKIKSMLDMSRDAAVFMRNMVRKVDKYINDGRNAGFTTSEQIWPLVHENVFQQNNPANDQFNADLDRYYVIPWIAKQYNTYYYALKADCLTIKDNEAYKEIMKLNP